ADYLSDYKGVTGLFIAGVLSGSLSTLSSSINSLAAVTLEDYIKPCLREPLSPTRAAVLTKALVLFYGMASIGFSFLAELMDGILQASLTVFGVVGGPLFGLFTLGMIFPFTSQNSSLPSFIVSLAVGLWIGFGGPKPPIAKLSMSMDLCDNSTLPSTYYDTVGSVSTEEKLQSNDEYFYLYELSYMWYTLIGFSITLVLGCLGSLVYPETKKLDPSLFSPVIGRILRARSTSSSEKLDH
ncbi:unnamed protein product, partial [Allacma fusca]